MTTEQAKNNFEGGVLALGGAFKAVPEIMPEIISRGIERLKDEQVRDVTALMIGAVGLAYALGAGTRGANHH